MNNNDYRPKQPFRPRNFRLPTTNKRERNTREAAKEINAMFANMDLNERDEVLDQLDTLDDTDDEQPELSNDHTDNEDVNF